MYLLWKKPITPAKLAKERDLLKFSYNICKMCMIINFRFWKTLGSYMSKISNTEKSVIHLMESNVAGNKQGEEVHLKHVECKRSVSTLTGLTTQPKIEI